MPSPPRDRERRRRARVLLRGVNVSAVAQQRTRLKLRCCLSQEEADEERCVPGPVELVDSSAAAGEEADHVPVEAKLNGLEERRFDVHETRGHLFAHEGFFVSRVDAVVEVDDARIFTDKVTTCTSATEGVHVGIVESTQHREHFFPRERRSTRKKIQKTNLEN